MKKRVFLACLVGLLTATSAYSYTGDCNGGTIISDIDKKTTFCMSDKTMNWWSAQNWCKVNGSSLATMYEICPSWDGSTGQKCSELKGYDELYVWSATVYGSENAFIIRLSDGYVFDDHRRNEHQYNLSRAFCR